MKKAAVVISILALVSLVILGAGCVTPDTSAVNKQAGSVPTDVSATNKVTVNDIAGTWYATSPYSDGDIMALLKLEINPDGTGAETWYNNKDDTPYCYNTFHISKLTNVESENKGMFDLIFDPPLSSNNWQIIGNSDGLSSTLDVSFSKTPDKGYWNNYKEIKGYPTPEITKEHHPADYIEDGNYYLEDDNGRSFTDTLWTGDVAPYVAEYKDLPKLSNGGSQAGNWVKFVRGLSKSHHALEPTTQVLYQTVDETMSRGYGTCDDLAILAARGLKELGYNVSILVFPNHMDIGVSKDDYLYFNKYITNDWYAIYQSQTPLIYDGYYYIDIANWQKNTDLGNICTEEKFKYDMTLKKMIVL